MSNYRTDDVERLASIFAALSNPNRARIFVQLLARCSDQTAAYSEDEVCACVGELGRDLGIAPSTVSHHIKELNRAGLIKMERCGRSVRCWVDSDTIHELAGFFGQAAPEMARSTEGIDDGFLAGD